MQLEVKVEPCGSSISAFVFINEKVSIRFITPSIEESLEGIRMRIKQYQSTGALPNVDYVLDVSVPTN